MPKVRAAKAEAMQRDGTEAPENGPAADWAWDVVGDLLRLDEAPRPDAELIAACNEFLRIQRDFKVVCAAFDDGDDDVPSDHPAWALLDPVPELVEKIVALPATTPEGIAARSHCATFHCLPNNGGCQDDPDGAHEDRFRAALMRDLVAMKRGSA